MINNWLNVPTAQTPIFELFLSARVLFDGAFSMSILKTPFTFSDMFTLRYVESLFTNIQKQYITC